MRLRRVSQHYRFFCNPGSHADAAIEDVVALQEACFRVICRELRVRPPRWPVRYYLCDSPQEVGRLYGDNDPANARTKGRDKVFAVYRPGLHCVGFHEDAHIISHMTLGRPRAHLLGEGLAMYFDRVWWGIPTEVWALRWLLSGHHLRSLASNELFEDLPEYVSYPLSGVVVERLVRIGGMRRFKRLYRTRDVDLPTALRRVCKTTLDSIERDVIEQLRSVRYDNALVQRMDELLGDRNH